MVQIGYARVSGHYGPSDPVDPVVGAHDTGFDFSVTSGHRFLWPASQRRSPDAWSVLGAAARTARCIPLMTRATCPTTRYRKAPLPPLRR